MRPRRSKHARSNPAAQYDSINRSGRTSEGVPVEVGRLYVLDGRLVRLDRRDSSGQVVVQDQIDGTERHVPAGMLVPRALDCACETGGVIKPSGSTFHPPTDATPPDMTPSNICRLTDVQKKVALERLDVIQPLIELPTRTKQDVSRIVRIPREREQSFHGMVNTDSTAT